MKRLLIVLLALTVLGVFAFADDMAAPAPAPIGTFTSWNTGTALLYNSVNGAAATTGWGPAWDSVSGIDQEWTFGYAGKGYGFSADLEFGMDNFGNSGASATGVQGATISRFYTYYDVLPSMVEVILGKPRMGRAPGSLVEGMDSQFYMNSQFGAALKLLPMSGFSAWAFAELPQSGAVSNLGSQLTFSAEYTMPDVFYANAMYSTINSDFSGGVKVTAIKPLTIVAGWDYKSSATAIWASAGGSFVDKLTTNLDFAMKSTSAVTSIGLEAQAQYAIGTYGVGARVGYDDGQGVGVFGDNLGDIGDNGGVLVYPYVVANFDNGSSVQFGVSYESGANNMKSLLQIPILYVWAF